VTPIITYENFTQSGSLFSGFGLKGYNNNYDHQFVRVSEFHFAVDPSYFCYPKKRSILGWNTISV
jgi:hypothetical protein